MKKLTLTFSEKEAAMIAEYATKHNIGIAKAIKQLIANGLLAD